MSAASGYGPGGPVNQPMNLNQLLQEAMNQENMWAFCDLVGLDDKAALSGMIKLARPKPAPNQRLRLPLLIILDTPDEATHAMADRALANLAEAVLEIHGQEAAHLLAMPANVVGEGIYMKRVDMTFAPTQRLDRDFITETIIPFLGQAMGVMAFDLAWWSEEQEPLKTGPKTNPLMRQKAGAQYQDLRRSFNPRLGKKVY